MNIIQQPLYKMLAVDDEIIFVVEDTNIVSDEALHPIELLAKSYRL